MRPGHIGKDARLLGTVANCLERRERLLVEIDGFGVIAAACGRSGQPAE